MTIPMKHKTELNATSEKNGDAATEIKSLFDGDDVLIYSYSRRQAIEDGVLIDVTKMAKEAGFRYPVALTYAAWHQCVRVNPCNKCQDESGRLWDLLNCLRIAARSESGSYLKFSVLVKQPDNKMLLVQLKSICGPGDNYEPVVTIMLPNED
jgi:hypothetical protein